LFALEDLDQGDDEGFITWRYEDRDEMAIGFSEEHSLDVADQSVLEFREMLGVCEDFLPEFV